MQFSNTTLKSGIIQACEDYTGLGDAGISSNATLLRSFTRRINEANRRVISVIFEVSGVWAFDDSNQTDLPQATTNLVSGTSKYSLPATALTVERIDIKDQNGNWYKLHPLTKEELYDGVDDFMIADGYPTYYRLVGQTIELFPASNYNSTDGLKVYFLRDGVEFSYSDTIATPGFASLYHNAIAASASLDWLKTNKPTSPTTTRLKEDEIEYFSKIADFYARRWKDDRIKLTTRYNNPE